MMAKRFWSTIKEKIIQKKKTIYEKLKLEISSNQFTQSQLAIRHNFPLTSFDHSFALQCRDLLNWYEYLQQTNFQCQKLPNF